MFANSVPTGNKHYLVDELGLIIEKTDSDASYVIFNKNSPDSPRIVINQSEADKIIHAIKLGISFLSYFLRSMGEKMSQLADSLPAQITDTHEIHKVEPPSQTIPEINHFSTLPEELLQRILVDLPLHDIKNASLTHSSWHTAIQDDYFWKQMLATYFPKEKTSGSQTNLEKFKECIGQDFYTSTNNTKTKVPQEQKSAYRKLFTFVREGNLNGILQLQQSEPCFKDLALYKLLEIGYAYQSTPLYLAISFQHQHILDAYFDSASRNFISFVNKFFEGANNEMTMGLILTQHLHVAILSNQAVDKIKALIALGVNFHEEKNATIPLFFAVKEGRYNIVRVLLENKANPDTTVNKTPAIHAAVSAGRIDIVQALIDSGADINKTDGTGRTPLYVAIAENSHLDLIQLLLKHGADVDLTDSIMHITPLHLAAFQGRFDLVKLLLEKKADPNIPGPDGAIPLHTAIIKKHLTIAETLLKYGSQHDKAMSSENLMPLHAAAFVGDVNAISLLIENGADINAPRRDGATALYMAACEGHLNAVRLLISKGASVNQIEKCGATPLHCAAYTGKLEVALELIKANADVNQKTKDDATPLYFAVQEGKLDVLLMLSANGADINLPHCSGTTPLLLAVKKGQLDIMLALLKMGSDVNRGRLDSATPLYFAILRNDIDATLALLAFGADVNKDIDTKSISAADLSTDLIATVSNHRNDQMINEYHLSPLCTAAMNGHFDIVLALLINGANVKHSYLNMSAFDIAKQKGHNDICILIELYHDVLSKHPQATLREQAIALFTWYKNQTIFSGHYFFNKDKAGDILHKLSQLKDDAFNQATFNECIKGMDIKIAGHFCTIIKAITSLLVQKERSLEMGIFSMNACLMQASSAKKP
jgi:ankyrin repeat protein